MAVDAAAAGRTSTRTLFVIGSVMLGVVLAAIDQTIVATALPTIATNLGGFRDLSWVMAAYLVTTTATVPVYGRVGDILGRKPVYQAAIGIFLLGSVLCGMAQTLPQLVLARAVQGLGGGGLLSVGSAIVAELVPPRQRGRYQGYIGALTGLASVAGPLLGGVIVDHAGWRWVFFVNVPVGLAAVGLIAVTLHLQSQRRPRRIDVLGAALVLACVGSVVTVLALGGTRYPWTSPPVLGLIAAGAILLVLLVAWERRAAEPILPGRLFRNRILLVSSAVSAVTWAALFAGVIFLPLYLQTVGGQSATSTGLLLLPMMTGVVVASIVSGRVISRTGRYKAWPVAGTALVAAGMLVLSRLTASSSIWLAFAGMVLLGLGIGMVIQVLLVVVQNAVEFADLGAATSVLTFFRSLGGVLGTALFGAVFAGQLGARLAGSVPADLVARLESGVAVTPGAALHSVSPATTAAYERAISGGVEAVFLVGLPFALTAFALSLALREIPLRTVIRR